MEVNYKKKLQSTVWKTDCTSKGETREASKEMQTRWWGPQRGKGHQFPGWGWGAKMRTQGMGEGEQQ